MFDLAQLGAGEFAPLLGQRRMPLVPGAGIAHGAAPSPRVPALLAASSLHAIVLGLALLATRSHHVPDTPDSPSFAMVFAPQVRDPALVPPPPMPGEPPSPALVPAGAAAPVSGPPPTPLAEPSPAPPSAVVPVPEVAPAPSPPPRAAEAVRPLARARPHPVTIVPRPATPNPAAEPAPSRVIEGEPVAAARPAPAPLPAPVDAGWRDGLISWLQAHKTYPATARMAGAEGRVLVRFTASRDGRVLDVALAQSSGSRALDDAATALLRGAHLPSFPASMKQDAVTVTLPLSYQLD